MPELVPAFSPRVAVARVVPDVIESAGGSWQQQFCGTASVVGGSQRPGRDAFRTAQRQHTERRDGDEQDCEHGQLPGSDGPGQRRTGRLLPPAAARMIASTERSTSSAVVAQFETEMRIAAIPCQVVPLNQHVPSSWTA